MKLTIIRHGKTRSNVERRYAGCRTDLPLTDAGKAELAAVSACGENMPDPGKTAVFVSPMLRARQTAEILFPGVPQTVVDELREMDFGKFEGKNYIELNGDPDYQAWVDSGCTAPIPEGESMESFTERSVRGMEKAVRASAGCDEIYIVAHGGTVMALMSTLTGGNYYDFYSGNGCGYTIELEVDDAGNIIAAGAYDSFCGGVHSGSADR